MKLNKILLMAAIAVGLVACNNDDNDVPQSVKPGEGNTFAGMVISTNPKTRSLDQDDNAGIEAESGLNSLKMLSTAGDQTWTPGTAATPAAGTFWETENDSKIYTVSPWKTEAGTQKMGLIFNEPTSLGSYDVFSADALVFGTNNNPVADIAAFSSANKFVMTSKISDEEIQKDISKSAVENAGHEDKTNNVFPFEVERVVAQGKVALNLAPESAPVEGMIPTTNKDGDIVQTSLMYAAINGAVPTYVFAGKAGERKINGTSSDEDYLQYKGFASFIDEAIPEFEKGKDHTSINPHVKDLLIRLGNLHADTNDDLGGYKAISVVKDEATALTTAGIYFFENSVNKDYMTPENNDFGFYRLAYAKIYATFVPKVVYTIDKEAGEPPLPIVEKTNYKPGETFYKGAEDGLFYDSKEAARQSLGDRYTNQKSFTYTNGKCAYRALWNRQTVEEGTGGDKKVRVKNADARRNNIYLVSIAGFKSIGMPWDSSDPDDPNLPKPTPDDPDDPDPDNPDDPDIEKQDTYMRVVGKILPWNLVKRSEILD